MHICMHVALHTLPEFVVLDERVVFGNEQEPVAQEGDVEDVDSIVLL
jgi:hypothetical protein